MNISQHLAAAGKLYPKAWQQVTMMRRDRGVQLPDWPQWCFMPLAGWYSIVSADSGHYHLPPNLVPDVGRLAARGGKSGRRSIKPGQLLGRRSWKKRLKFEAVY
jgi:hypothetical protein